MSIWRKLVLPLPLAILVFSAFVPGLTSAQETRTNLVLNLLPGHYYRGIAPGEENRLYVEIRNNGDSPVTGITMEQDAPEGWMVQFQPASISSLPPGSSQAIDVIVIPALDAEAGEHTLVLIANAVQTRAVASTVLRIEEDTSFWLWIGVGLAGVVIAGFIYVYLRFGRQ